MQSQQWKIASLKPDEILVTLSIERFVLGSIADLPFEEGDVELAIDRWQVWWFKMHCVELVPFDLAEPRMLTQILVTVDSDTNTLGWITLQKSLHEVACMRTILKQVEGEVDGICASPHHCNVAEQLRRVAISSTKRRVTHEHFIDQDTKGPYVAGNKPENNQLQHNQ